MNGGWWWSVGRDEASSWARLGPSSCLWTGEMWLLQYGERCSKKSKQQNGQLESVKQSCKN